MDWVDAELCGQGRKDRRKDRHGSSLDDEAADEQQKQHRQQEEGKLVAGNAHDSGRQLLRDLPTCQHPGECLCGSGHEQDGRGDLRCVQNRPPHDFYGKLLRNKAYDQRIQRGDRAGLGRGEDARQDAADNDKGCHKCRDRVDERAQALLPRNVGTCGVLMYPCKQIGGDHEEQADQDARNDTGHQQGGHRGPCNRAIQHEDDAGRDDRPEDR